MKKKTGIRFLSLLLSLAMVLGCFPAVSFAAEDDLCEHHPEHTDSCGYAEEANCTYDCQICTAAAVNSFDSLHEIVNASESMTADEIRQAVQSLDQDQLLSDLRSSGGYGEAYRDYRTLSSAAGSSQAVISPNISILYGTNLYWGFAAHGLSLNNPVFKEDNFTLTIDKPNVSIDIPEGYILSLIHI